MTDTHTLNKTGKTYNIRTETARETSHGLAKQFFGKRESAKAQTILVGYFSFQNFGFVQGKFNIFFNFVVRFA